MYRGTTPRIDIKVRGMDLTGAKTFVTLKQGPVEITKVDIPCESTDDGCKLTVTLTQQETLRYKAHTAFIQMRWLTADGKAYASPAKAISLKEILKQGVIE